VRRCLHYNDDIGSQFDSPCVVFENIVTELNNNTYIREIKFQFT